MAVEHVSLPFFGLPKVAKGHARHVPPRIEWQLSAALLSSPQQQSESPLLKTLIHSFDHMFKSTSAQTKPSTPSAPDGTTTNPSMDYGDKKSAQQQVELHISKFKAAQAKSTEFNKEFNLANKQIESHQAKIKIHNDNLEVINTQARIATQELINNNAQKIQKTSQHFNPTSIENTNITALATLVKNDPTLIKIGSQLRSEQEGHYNETLKLIKTQTEVKSLSQKKEIIHTNLQNSRIELTKSINALEESKSGADNEREIELLVCVANQAIATADFSTASQNLMQAKEIFETSKNLLNGSSEKLKAIPELLEVQYAALNAAQEEFTKSSAYKYKSNDVDAAAYRTAFLSNPENKKLSDTVIHSLNQLSSESKKNDFLKTHHFQAEQNLTDAKTILHQTAAILKKCNSAVEEAKSALDQYIADMSSSNSVDDAILANEAPDLETGDSLAIDETQVYEPVIATGVDEHLELI